VANEFDNIDSQIITDSSIKTKYLELFSNANSNRVFGIYEDRKKRAWWVNPDTGDCLVYEVNLNAFYPQKIAIPEVSQEKIIGAYDTEGSDEIIFLSSVESPTKRVAFASLSDEQFLDWGVADTGAYLVGGPENLGQFSQKKGATSIVMHFRRTETTVSDDGNGGYAYDYPSSCILSAIADNSSYTGHTTKPQQMYRLNRRGWIPELLPIDLSQQGDDIVVVKDKIRAKGNNLKLRIDTEPGKDCQVLGYSVDYSMRGRQ
jgi:hypothetical protein